MKPQFKWNIYKAGTIIVGIVLWVLIIWGIFWLAGCTVHKKIIVNVEQVDIRLELKGD